MFKWLQKKYEKLAKNRAYEPKKYWQARHKTFGCSLRGVGNKTLSEEENRRQYQKAGQRFVRIIKNCGVDLPNAKVLEIGCGTGFYTQLLSEMGVKDYTGIDIAPHPLKTLRNRFPAYKFQRMDIASQALSSSYDLIIMIDVTQHIVDQAAFSFAMTNVKNHIDSRGFLVVTSWLAERDHLRTHYERARTISSYKECFGDLKMSKPIKFRDKYLLLISPSVGKK